jgi:ubiquinone/menaquinone biosynthesis C-methylase UbiE
MNNSDIAGFKDHQRAMWPSFAPSAIFTTPVAAHLVSFAGVQAGLKILDVGTGTGVVAITAARHGAHVTGLDLTPELLEQAKEDAAIAGQTEIIWQEGDAEALPYADNSFDLVLSQFGHMFAPRPDVVVKEIQRVLRKGGRFAFASWPPEHLMGKLFALVNRVAPVSDTISAKPEQWGDPHIIQERLQGKFDELFFERGTMLSPALSVAHRRIAFERSFGPLKQTILNLAGDAVKLKALRADLDAIIAPHFHANQFHQSYLMTRCVVMK